MKMAEGGVEESKDEENWEAASSTPSERNRGGSRDPEGSQAGQGQEDEASTRDQRRNDGHALTGVPEWDQAFAELLREHIPTSSKLLKVIHEGGVHNHESFVRILSPKEPALIPTVFGNEITMKYLDELIGLHLFAKFLIRIPKSMRDSNHRFDPSRFQASLWKQFQASNRRNVKTEAKEAITNKIADRIRTRQHTRENMEYILRSLSRGRHTSSETDQSEDDKSRTSRKTKKKKSEDTKKDTKAKSRTRDEPDPGSDPSSSSSESGSDSEGSIPTTVKVSKSTRSRRTSGSSHSTWTSSGTKKKQEQKAFMNRARSYGKNTLQRASHVKSTKQKNPPKLVKRQALTGDVKWDNKRSSFPDLRSRIEGHLLINGMAYMIDPKFIKIYRSKGTTKALESRIHEEITLEQFYHDRNFLYGLLMSIFRTGKAQRYVRQYAKNNDGIRTYDAIITEYGLGGNQDVLISKQEIIINTEFSKGYPGGLTEYLDDIESAYADLEWLGEPVSDRKRFDNLMRTLLIPDFNEWMISHCESNYKGLPKSFESSLAWLRAVDAKYDNKVSSKAKRNARTAQTTGSESGKL